MKIWKSIKKYSALPIITMLFGLIVLAVISNPGSHDIIEEIGTNLPVDIFFADNITHDLVRETVHLNLDDNLASLMNGHATIPQDHIEEFIPLILEALQAASSPTGRQNILPQNILLRSFHYNQGDLSLNFSWHYDLMPPYQEIMARVGIVHTFAGLNYIDNIKIYVESGLLQSPTLNPIGSLNLDNVILGAQVFYGETPIVFQRVDFYYVSPDMQGLVVESIAFPIPRDATDATILSDVLHHHLNRTTNAGRLFIPPETRIIHVHIVEDMAYIDFSEHFDTRPQQGEIAQYLTVYAIVNTLTSLDIGIKEIQFFIEGGQLSEYEGYVDLYNSFARNEDIYVFRPYELD